MTALSAVTDACNELGIAPPVSLVTANDLWSAQCLALLNLALSDASRECNWPILETDYSFPTVIGTAQYVPPADYRSLASNTLYNSASYYRLRGAMSAASFQEFKRLLIGPTVARAAFRIYGKPLRINISPTPTAVETLVLLYRTSNFAASGAGAAQVKYLANTDVSVIDEDVVKRGFKWRLKHAKGLDYSEDYNDYVTKRDRAFAEALASPMIVIGGQTADTPLTQGFVREGGFGA